MHLKDFFHRASAYLFGAILDGCLKFCIYISVSAMTLSVAYVSRKLFTPSFQEDSIPYGLFKVFLFSRYRRGNKETSADLVMKYSTHHMAALSWIPFDPHVCLYVTRNVKTETKHFLPHFSLRYFWYPAYFFATFSE